MKSFFLQLNKLLLNKVESLPNWGSFLIYTLILFILIGIWVIFVEPISKWVWDSLRLSYVFASIIYSGLAIISGYYFVKISISAIRGIFKNFGEIKIKELPTIFGYFVIWLICAFFVLTFFGAAFNTILSPFNVSLQSLGIVPKLYPGYFVDNPVYIFGYKIIPLFDLKLPIWK